MSSRTKPFPELDATVRRHVVDYLRERVTEARIDKPFLEREYGRGFLEALDSAIAHLGPTD